MLLTRADGQNLAGTKLQFRHTADGDWFDVPNFPNASSNVYLYEFRCVCSHMRLNFTGSGSAPYALTMVCAAESTF